jgi:hypothetical protein
MPLKVPSTEVIPREGSFALASVGRVRKSQETTFSVVFGRKSFAVKRITEPVLVWDSMLAHSHNRTAGSA